MIAVLQRVTQARVEIASEVMARIGRGLLVLVAVERGDQEPQANRLLQRLLGYRVFNDGSGRMNRSLEDVRGDLLLVPQFTLAADTSRGMRPGFSPAASPSEGERLYRWLVAQAGRRYAQVESGIFGADMQVQLINDGPVTFWIRVPPESSLEEIPR